jgi:hypothetical protein
MPWNPEIALLTRVAIEAPLRQGKYSRSATIDWRTVNEIRSALERLDVNWRPAHQQLREIKLKRSQAARKAKEEEDA